MRFFSPKTSSFTSRFLKTSMKGIDRLAGGHLDFFFFLVLLVLLVFLLFIGIMYCFRLRETMLALFKLCLI